MRGAQEAEIGETLSAQFVVTGAYTSRNGGVQVDMKLTDVRSGRIMWSHRLHQALDEFVLEPAILSEIAAEIQRVMLQEEVRRALSSPMPNLESYTLLMSAVALMHRLSPGEFELSRQMLQTLIDRSSHSPTAQAWMAKWHVLRVQQGWTDSPEREAKLARICTRKALASDPTNVPALVAEGFVLNNLMHRLDDAEERYDAALAQSPNDAMGRLLRGTLYAFRGEGAAAMRDTERALVLAPLDPHRFFFHSLAASACITAENYPRALDLATRSLRSNRAHTSTLRVKAVAEMRLGQGDAARETARQLMRRQPDLTVSKWLKTAPSADYAVGRAFAQSLREAGVPE
jgi:tetratricopeptide (TPR) repeat protein